MSDTLVKKIVVPKVGEVSFVEFERHLPFPVRRAYWITGALPGDVRGLHAHKATEQAVFCVAGRVTFVLDNGISREEVVLDRPNEGILINTMTWREMKDFAPCTVIAVFASTLYDEADYVRNYDEFLRLARDAKDHA